METLNTHKPTDEELFDYHLGLCDPGTARKITAYLSTHPELSQKLKEYDQIADNFKNMPFSQPSVATLESVRANAAKYASPSFGVRFQDWALGLFSVRRTVWATMLVLVVAMGYTLSDLRQNNTGRLGITIPKIALKTNKTKIKAGLEGLDTTAAAVATAHITTQTPPHLDGEGAETDLLKDYVTAVDLFNQNRFAEAAVLFDKIVAAKPDFEKRAELYPYWISALQKLGSTDEAQKRQTEWEQLKNHP